MLESSTNRLEFSAISREIFRDKIFNTAGFEFRGQFPYLDKLQYTGFIQWVESQSDYQKFNIQCLVFNNIQLWVNKILAVVVVVVPIKHCNDIKKRHVSQNFLQTWMFKKTTTTFHKMTQCEIIWN